MPCDGRSSAFLQENCSRYPLFSGHQEQFRYVFALGQFGKSVRGTNFTRHGIMRKSPPGNHSRHINFPEDRARSHIVKPTASLTPVEQIKSLLQRNIQSLRNLHHNTPDALPPDYVADFSVLLRRKIVQVLYGILIKAAILPICSSSGVSWILSFISFYSKYLTSIP